MRAFALLAPSLLALPAFASHGHDHARRHHNIARSAEGGNFTLGKRDFPGARLTYYDITVGTTACGGNYPASAFVVALDTPLFGSGYPGPNCGKAITITANGKTTGATIVDECPGCPYGGLDLTQGLFSFFSDIGAGVLTGEWSFDDGGDAPAPSSSSQAPPPPPSSTWTPPPSSTSTWTPPPSSSSSPPPPPSSSSSWSSSSSYVTTSTSSSASSSSSSTSSSTTTSSAGVASGLSVPAGTVENDSGNPQNLNGLSQVLIGLGGVIQAAARG